MMLTDKELSAIIHAWGNEPTRRNILDLCRDVARAQEAAERERRQADARLAAFVRERAEPAPDGWRIDVWISGAPSLETMDDALGA
jgi:hypothetical protein